MVSCVYNAPSENKNWNQLIAACVNVVRLILDTSFDNFAAHGQMNNILSTVSSMRKYVHPNHRFSSNDQLPGLILGLRPANERRRYEVTPSLIGWART